MGRRKAFLVVALILSFSISSMIVLENIENTPQLQYSEHELRRLMHSTIQYIDHDPIYVTDNSDFISQANLKGWLGNGTELNPYIISGISITGNGEGIPRDPDNPPSVNMSDPFRFLININNTNLHFHISNSLLAGAGRYAIYLYNVSNARINGNRITSSNWDGLRLEYAENCTIYNNSVYNNSLRGIDIRNSNNIEIYNNSGYSNGVNGFYFGRSRNNTINNNIAYNNLWHGISIDDYSHDNTIINNTAYNNSMEGIGLWDSNNNKIHNNSVYDNNWCGIYLYSSISNTISSNTIFNQGWEGIELDEYSSINNIYNNSIYNNYNGIILYSASSVTIENNTLFYNSYNGITLIDSARNSIIHNFIINNGENGISLDGSSHHNLIVNNSIFNNEGYGILIGSSDNTFSGNNFSNNQRGETQTVTYPSWSDLTTSFFTFLIGLVIIGILIFFGLSIGAIIILRSRAKPKVVPYSTMGVSQRGFQMEARTESGFCFNCGSRIPPKAKFCNLCGTSLEEMADKRVKTKSDPFYSDDFEKRESDFSSGYEKVTCPVCGNITDQIKCEECGTQLKMWK